MDSKRAYNPHSLTLEQKINLARYRALDEMEREVVNLLVQAFQERHQGKQSIDVQALLGSFQECHLLAA